LRILRAEFLVTMPRRLSLAFLLPIIAAPTFAAPLSQPIGTWKSDNGQAYAEIHFRPDYSFTLFNRMSVKNPELAVAEMAEQFGTWRVEGDRLKIDATRRWSNQRSRLSLRFEVANRVLRLQNFYDPSKIDTYDRMQLPYCPKRSVLTSRGFNEHDLLGRWRCHYRTHDCKFVFESDHRAAAYVDGVRLFEGRWQVKGNTLTIKRRAERRDGFKDKINWTIVQTGAACFTINDGSSMFYTLQRLK
jgi:hypothetical protein